MNIRLGLVISLVLLQSLSAQEPAPQNASIRKQDLKADVYFLADDLTRGRLVGTPEYALAAEFVKSRFERLGLTTRSVRTAHTSTLQPDGRHARRRQHAWRWSTSAAGTLRFRPGQDFYPHRFGAQRHASRAPVVFAGFGITAPARNHDDYAATASRARSC